MWLIVGGVEQVGGRWDVKIVAFRNARVLACSCLLHHLQQLSGPFLERSGCALLWAFTHAMRCERTNRSGASDALLTRWKIASGRRGTALQDFCDAMH